MLNRLYTDIKAGGVLIGTQRAGAARCELWQRERYNYKVLIHLGTVLKIIGRNYK